MYKKIIITCVRVFVVVPLTVLLQMYVPGKLHDVDHVLVEIGTGYFVEKVSQA